MIALAVACGCAAVIVWFSARARLGARARKVAGVRLRTTDRLSASFSQRSAARAVVGLLAGVVFGGTTLGVAGIAVGLASEPLLRSRAVRLELRKLEEQLPDVLRSIAAALRGGRNLPQALAAARDEAPEPSRTALHGAVRRLDVGAPVDDALDVFARRARSVEAGIAVDTILVGRAAGSNLPKVLDVLVDSLTERIAVARDRRAATSQARLSAAVVGGMPLVFLLMVGGPQQRAVLFRDPVGWVLLGCGVAIDAAGVLWMRKLMRS